MTLTSLLDENDTSTTLSQANLKPKSCFTPNIGSFKNIELFLEAVKFEIENIKSMDLKRNLYMNLTKQENKALHSLRHNKMITIRPADKGGNIVIRNSSDNVGMAFKILEDKDAYHLLKTDPTNAFLHDYKQILDNRGLLSKEEYDFLLNRNPRIATFYCLPKIHKNQSNPPGHPIVSKNREGEENGRQYIDTLLQPSVKLMRSYLKDSMTLLRFLNNFSWMQR
ncbi:Hypothetical predicted protein, partial [Pelobates cultripes]